MNNQSKHVQLCSSAWRALAACVLFAVSAPNFTLTNDIRMDSHFMTRSLPIPLPFGYILHVPRCFFAVSHLLNSLYFAPVVKCYCTSALLSISPSSTCARMYICMYVSFFAGQASPMCVPFAGAMPHLLLACHLLRVCVVERLTHSRAVCTYHAHAPLLAYITFVCRRAPRPASFRSQEWHREWATKLL